MKHHDIALRLASSALCGALLLTGCGQAVPAATTEPSTVPTTQETVSIVTEATEERPTLATLPPRDPTALAVPEYPVMNPYPQMDMDDFDPDKYEELVTKWYETVELQRPEPGYADGLEHFWQKGMTAFLGQDTIQNKVISPVNLYMALGMLAQVTDGDSRTQILTALGGGTMSHLRKQLNDVWNAQYRDDGATTMVLANSLWLNEDLPYNMDTLHTLSKSAMASSHAGVPGSPELDQAYRDWINQQTGDLLQAQVDGMTLDPSLVLALVSTVNYHAKWMDPFQEEMTVPKIFHGKGGKDAEVPFLHREMQQNYFEAENFTALPLELENDGGMLWLLRPAQGRTPESLMQQEETFRFLEDPWSWENNRYVKVQFSMPKFDITTDLDLKEGFAALGISNVFDARNADFSPLLTEEMPISLTQARHAVRFAADEEGITAVSFVELQMAGDGRPPEEEVDFTLDHPFLFVLTTKDGLPLFAGVLNQLEAE